MRLLFPGGDPSAMSPDAFADMILPVALDSADLADEPEFADLTIPPLEATEAYIGVMQGLGVRVSDIDGMDEEVRDELIGQAIDDTTTVLFTPQLHQQIRTGLMALRARLRRTNQTNELPRVAAVQMFLEMDRSGQVAPALGLVQEIVRRSISVGFDMAQVISEVQAVDKAGGPLTPQEMVDRISQSEITAKLAAMLDTMPGLRHFLLQQAEEMRDVGKRALFEGRLRLDLYSPAELEDVVNLIKEAIGADLSVFRSFGEHLENIMPKLMPPITEHVRNLFGLPERTLQLRQRMDDLVADPAYTNSEWMPFILALRGDLQKEDGVAYILGDLVAALFGELWPLLLTLEAFEADQQSG